MGTKRKPPVARIRERDVQAQVLEIAGLHGLVLRRQNTGVGTYANADGSSRHVRYGDPGDSDLTGTWGLPGRWQGRRIDVEVKAPGKRPTPEQLAKLRRLNDEGGIGIWTDSPEHFEKAIRRLKEGWRVIIDEEGNPWTTDE